MLLHHFHNNFDYRHDIIKIRIQRAWIGVKQVRRWVF